MSAPRGWRRIYSAPRDGTRISVWIDVPASPRSMGIADAWEVAGVWFQDGAWVHEHNGRIKELYLPYVTHWKHERVHV